MSLTIRPYSACGTSKKNQPKKAKSFNFEADHNNITEEHVAHFAKELELDQATIQRFVDARDWRGLFEHLATQVPRKGDYRRYDM